MKAPWSLIPLLPVTAAFVGGLILNEFLSVAAVAIIPAATALVFLICRKSYGFALSIIFTAGYLDGFFNAPEPLDNSLENTPALYSGVVEHRKETATGISVTLRVDSVDNRPCRSFGMILSLPGDNPIIVEQNRIAVRTAATTPVFDPDLPDEIDYVAKMRRRGVVATAFAPPDSIRMNLPAAGIVASIRRFRNRFADMIWTSGVNSPTAEFLITSLTGDTGGIDNETRQLFAETGLAHVLAISGLHVGIIAWIASLLLWPVYATGYRNQRYVAVLILLWLYAIMTGLSPSVTRAVIMATVFGIGLIAGRRRSPLNSLCMAVTVILALWPATLTSPGFQMSVAAVLSIILFSDKLNPFDRRNQPRLHYITQIFTVSISAMLGAGILAAFYFHLFPLYFILSAVVSSLILPVLLGGGIIAAILSGFGITSGALSLTLDALYDTVICASRLIASLPGSSIDNLYIDPLTVICWFGALATVYFAVATSRFKIASFVATGWIATAVAVTAITTPDYPDEEVYFSRRHQATSVIVKSGTRMWLITSAVNIADRKDIIAEMNERYSDYMRRRGIDSISPAPDSFATESITRRGPLLTICGKTYAMVSDENACATDVDRAVICRGFRGDIVSFALRNRVGEVLLGNDLNLRRHDRYQRELEEAGITVRSLRVRFDPCQ